MDARSGGKKILDLKSGVDNNELEKVHVRFLRHILGIGKNIIIMIIIIIIKGHSLRRACLQPATNTQNSKPRPKEEILSTGALLLYLPPYSQSSTL